MRLFLILAMAAVTVTTLSACQVTARDKDTYISVEDNNHSGTFCPPGHAKKDEC
jgi:hypothetical protein